MFGSTEYERGKGTVRAAKMNIALSGRDREELIGEYIIEHSATVRSAAAHFGVSKSTVHKDVSVRLRETDHELYVRVKAVLDRNKAERHIRGGEATRRKYMIQRQSFKNAVVSKRELS